jgi:hypothetical protein
LSGGKISNNVASGNGGGVWVTDDSSHLERLTVKDSVVFSNNRATTAYNRASAFDNIYNSQISSKVTWTTPFTQGYNNYDISYTSGTLIDMGNGNSSSSNNNNSNNNNSNSNSDNNSNNNSNSNNNNLDSNSSSSNAGNGSGFISGNGGGGSGFDGGVFNTRSMWSGLFDYTVFVGAALCVVIIVLIIVAVILFQKIKRTSKGKNEQVVEC